MGMEITSEAMQIFGGYGYTKDQGIEQLYRDNRITPIYEGTNSVQAIDLVFRKLVNQNGDIINKYINLIKKDLKINEEKIKPFIEKINGIKKITLPEKGKNPYVARLTLDYEEDYWLLKSIERICGALASRDSIDAFLIKNPDFFKINWFRNSQWKENQESKEKRIANNEHTFSD